MLADLKLYASLEVYAGLGIDQPGITLYTDPWALRSLTTPVEPFEVVSLGVVTKLVSLSGSYEVVSPYTSR